MDFRSQKYCELCPRLLRKTRKSQNRSLWKAKWR
nr:MAG TPA: hypothetical protein [Caudoviricetes sp.]